ncbi:MAG: hypothetical protein ABSF64_21470 [Bryobacteraceae bacterium]|jgi:hypothetical protein
MQNGERLSLQIRMFLAASDEFRFEANNREEVYGWVTRTLVEQEYGRQKREAKGLLRRYVAKMTGLSRAQMTRLVGQYLEKGMVKERSYRRNRFAKTCDVELLAAVDKAHETLSGPATQKILHREFHDYGDERYRRLAGISAAHIYNLRKSRAYRERKVSFQKTRPVKVTIGERRRPDPQGRPGFLRVDTVHQGDLEGIKGVYRINAVDEVTQWQVVGATAYISEAWLIPVLEAMLRQFPFQIVGFHSDNRSEFINHTVPKSKRQVRGRLAVRSEERAVLGRMLVDVHMYVQRGFDLWNLAFHIEVGAVARSTDDRQALGSGVADSGIIVLLRGAEHDSELFDREEVVVIHAGRVIEVPQKGIQVSATAASKRCGWTGLGKGAQCTSPLR